MTIPREHLTNTGSISQMFPVISHNSLNYYEITNIKVNTK